MESQMSEEPSQTDENLAGEGGLPVSRVPPFLRLVLYKWMVWFAALGTITLVVTLIVTGPSLFLIDLTDFPLAWLLVIVVVLLAAFQVAWCGFVIHLYRGQGIAFFAAGKLGWRLGFIAAFCAFFLSALAALIAAFAAATAAFQSTDWLTEEPASDGEGFVWVAVAYYTWHLLDAIPLLKVPDTINWKDAPTSTTDPFGGALLLLFKLLVIIPILQLILVLITLVKGTRETAEDASSEGDN